MVFHSADVKNVLETLRSDAARGLSPDEAAARLEKYGRNRLKEKRKKTLPERFFAQFKDVMILILLAAAAVSFVIALYEGNTKEFFEPLLILLIVALNATLGVLQESRAEKALDALKSLSAPHARVIRGGEEKIIDASELVPGDLIRLEAGDYVPADARLIRSSSLKVEEAALTGESLPSEKSADVLLSENAPLGDRANMVFSGCGVTYGRADAVVTATGMDTEVGRIAGLLSSEKEGQTPLQKKLGALGKYLGLIALAACAVVFAVGILDGLEVMEMFMTAVSLAVSAIPEGLPAIVTIVLSVGVSRMVKKNAIIRRLPAVETLGSASVICSDKTGTLTQNRMTLTRLFADGAQSPEALSVSNTDSVRRLLMLGTLCCNGTVTVADGRETHIGDPTETAIVFAAYKNGMVKDELSKKYPRLAELPFDSERKLMSVVCDINGKNVVIVKGAFDCLAPKCVAGDIARAREICDAMGADALRVLAIAYKEIDALPENPASDELESGLAFLGLLGMIDPPRPEAREAVDICRRAGIKPVMITGDHVLTAAAIARELGILGENDAAITGAELDNMTDDELDSRIKNIAVYARVSPENKIRIVKTWQRLGEVVAMTGDGVNDAPALKAADIGCAMGITGTDVAKGASDMTLSDDNFATIVDAVKEGRGIYANIKKVVEYLLGCNIGEIFAVFFAMLLWRQTPLLSMQLLWINLVTDGLPAVALGMEAVESDVMLRKPRSKSEGLFAHGLGLRLFIEGCMFGILTLIAFYIGYSRLDTAAGRTMAFFVLSLSQIVQAFNIRSERSLFAIGPFTNKKLNLAVISSIALMALVLFTPVSVPFAVKKLPIKYYLGSLCLSLSPFILTEAAKFIGLIRPQTP